MESKIKYYKNIINALFIIPLIFAFLPVKRGFAGYRIDSAQITYDDTDPAISYAGDWKSWSDSRASNGSMKYTIQIGSTASLSFTGTQIKIVYHSNILRGEMSVSIDGNIVTGNQYGSGETWQKEWTSGPLANGSHTITITHLSGVSITLDALIVSGAVDNPILKYDDTDPAISYAGDWKSWSNSKAYNGSFMYTTQIGATASLSFTGTLVKIVYQSNMLRGEMSVSIDGNVVTVNQYDSGEKWQKEWGSALLVNGPHTITITHLSGVSITLDAFSVISPPLEAPPIEPTMMPTTPPSTKADVEGYYDDIDDVFTYSGDWSLYSHLVGGPYEGTGHYSLTSGNSSELKFTGSGITLIYTGDNNRGIMEILVDGESVANLDQHADGLQWQKDWWLNNQSWSSGEHALVFRHTSGDVVDIDAVKIGKHAICSSSSNSAEREGIIRIQLNSGDKSSTRTPYTDNPEIFTTLNTGGTYTISITAEKGNPDPYAIYAKVWIDFNNDGNFEELTTNIDQGMMQFFNGTYIFSKEFTVPTGLNPGDVKMRIVLRANALPDSCGQYDYGETEDFNITLQ